MKKLSEKEKLFALRRAKAQARRRSLWQQKKRARRLGLRPKIIVSENGKHIATRRYISKAMPSVFCLDENVDDTLKSLNEIDSTVIQRAMALREDLRTGKKRPLRNRAYFDFKTIKTIGPSAALVLAAIYQTSKSITGRRLQTVDEHLWHPSVRWTLRQLGFHELLEMRPYDNRLPYASDVVVQPFVCGQRADGVELGRLQEALALLLPEELRDKLFTAEPYGGMLEAILNSYSWAYPEDHSWSYDVLRNWWLTGAVDKETNQVLVCVYDHGVSIPHSLPHWTHWNKVEEYAQKIMRRLKLTGPLDHYTNDGLAIRLAMQIAKSATSLPQHGKGLHTMVEVAERARYGRLRILSRNGEYIWETGRRPRSITHEFPLQGTLVEWQLEL